MTRRNDEATAIRRSGGLVEGAWPLSSLRCARRGDSGVHCREALTPAVHRGQATWLCCCTHGCRLLHCIARRCGCCACRAHRRHVRAATLHCTSANASCWSCCCRRCLGRRCCRCSRRCRSRRRFHDHRRHNLGGSFFAACRQRETQTSNHQHRILHFVLFRLLRIRGSLRGQMPHSTLQRIGSSPKQRPSTQNSPGHSELSVQG